MSENSWQFDTCLFYFRQLTFLGPIRHEACFKIIRPVGWSARDGDRHHWDTMNFFRTFISGRIDNECHTTGIGYCTLALFRVVD